MNTISRLSIFLMMLTIVLSLSPTSVQATFVTTISVNTILPQHLRVNDDNGYRNVISAEFGRHHTAPYPNPAYDAHGSLVVNVYSASSPLCTAEQVQYTSAKKQREEWMPPFGLLVDQNSGRRGCTYVQQVRRAEALGAATVVLFNDRCLCEDMDECQDHHQPCESTSPILYDDGTGRDVNIPAVMLTKQDGSAIRQELQTSENSGVTMEFRWKPFRSNMVSVALWHTPFLNSDVLASGREEVGPEVAQWWHNMSLLTKTFADDAVEFSPHYLLLDGAELGCLRNPVCNGTCTNVGRYCDASGSSDSYYSNVEESLVRICIWRDTTNKEKWWNYVAYASEHCLQPEADPDAPKCLSQALENAGISQDRVKDCILDSGGIEDDVQNVLLTEELAMQTRHGFHINPTITVNQVDIHRAHVQDIYPYLSAASVFEATCNAFTAESKPAVCNACLQCSDPITCLSQSEPWSCDSQGHAKFPKKKSRHFRNFILWSIFLGGIAFAANKYKRFQNEQNLEQFFQNNRDYTLSENLFGNEEG